MQNQTAPPAKINEDKRIEQVQLRKYCSTLHICGVAAITFSAWSAIKNLGYFFLTDVYRNSMDQIGRTFFLALLVLLLIVGFSLHVYVGFSAIRESAEKSHGVLYLILVVLMILVSASSLTVVMVQQTEQLNIFDKIVSILVEITCDINLCELLYSSVMIKKIRKKKRAANGKIT